MASTRQRGNYYRLKTRRLYEKRGYDVEKMEVAIRIFDKRKGKLFQTRKDIWGADLVAKNAEEYILIQVKGDPGAAADAIQNFEKHAPWPAFIQLHVVLWTPGARGEPTIVCRDNDQEWSEWRSE